MGANAKWKVKTRIRFSCVSCSLFRLIVNNFLSRFSILVCLQFVHSFVLPRVLSTLCVSVLYLNPVIAGTADRES